MSRTQTNDLAGATLLVGVCGGIAAYKKKCDEVVGNGYDGFYLTGAEEQRFAAK